jgi:hypothetical protein
MVLTSSDPSGHTLRRYLPPQHGAWAMLLLPFLVGVACAGPVWLDVPLLLAWLGAYLLSYYALLVVKLRRIGRLAPQLALYGGITLPAALFVIVLRPRVLVFAPAFAVLLAVNAVFARRHADRSLAGGLASVLQGCLMVPVTAVVSGTELAPSVRPTLVLLAYFVGTLLYVKTMIRNRGETGYLRTSIGFHALAAAGAGLLAWPLALPFGWLLVRAAWLPHRSLTPKQVGMIEVPPMLALLVLVPLLFS